MKAPQSAESWGPVLRRALPEPALPAGFAKSVLRRIRADRAPWAEGLMNMTAFLFRPYSLGFLAFAMVVGAWDGFRQGMGDARLRAERAHVMAIDPETPAFLP